MSRLLLGVNIGTSFVKSALFDKNGHEVVTAASRVATLSSLPDWSEADRDLLWAATCGVIGRVLQADGVVAGDVAAVGVSGAMVGAWIIDAAGDALGARIFWNDGRTQPMIDAMIAEDPQIMSRIFAISGSVMQQGCTLPLLRWLSLNEPGVLDRARSVFGAKDYIRWRLTGAIATDVTEASVAPGSATDRGRSAALISLFGLDRFAHVLPPPVACENLAGTITQSAARATGLLAGTPVAIGAGDVACSILSTTCLNGIVMSQPTFTPSDLGVLFTLPEGLWLHTILPEFNQSSQRSCELTARARQMPPQVFSSQGICEVWC